jgi:hypothetical protein
MSEAQTLRDVEIWLYTEHVVHGAEGHYMPDMAARCVAIIQEAAAEIERLRQQAVRDVIAIETGNAEIERLRAKVGRYQDSLLVADTLYRDCCEILTGKAWARRPNELLVQTYKHSREAAERAGGEA